MLTKEAIDRLIDAGNEQRNPISTPDGGQAVALPAGYALHKLPPLEAPLTHTKQVVRLHDVESLIAYLEAYKIAPPRPEDEGRVQPGMSRIFAEPGFLATGQKARFVAVLDYHGADAPARSAHVATYEPRYSEAWERWHKACSAPMRQVDFCEFIEECRADIVEPDAAKLLDIVRTFKASKAVEFDSVTYQANGTVKLNYSEKVQQHGQASGELPEVMKLGIPVYYKGEHFAVPVFVRYRVSGGAVVFALKIDRGDVIEDDAFTGIAKKVEQTTAVPVHFGRLEGAVARA